MLAKLKNIGRKLNLFSTKIFVCLKTKKIGRRFTAQNHNKTEEGGWVFLQPLLMLGAQAIAVAIGTFAGQALTFASLAAGIVAVITLLGKILLETGAAMFKWAISSPFGSLTNPNQQDIINIGWTAMRDLTNMFFILGLAYIGLATALDIGGKFRTGNVFGKLLLVALLVNFSPVICGVVVDASNIVSNFFLSGVDFQALVQAPESGQYNLQDLSKDQITQQGPWWEFFVRQIYYALAGTVLWVFGLLFIMRAFVIWLLVIISPLAFLAGVFKQTEKQFERWKKALLDWSFIAVPAGFLLYLGHHVTYAFSQGIRSVPNASFFGTLTAYLIPVLFLWTALLTTKKVKAEGSSLLTNFTNKWIGKATALPGQMKKKLEPRMKELGKGAALGGLTGAIAGAKGGGGVMGTLQGAMRGAGTRAGRAEGRLEHERTKQPILQKLEDMGIVKPGTTRSRASKFFNYGETRKELDDYTLAELKTLVLTPQRDIRGQTLRALAVQKLINDEDFDFDPRVAGMETTLREMFEWMERDHKGIFNKKKLSQSRPDLQYLLDTASFDTEEQTVATANSSPIDPTTGRRIPTVNDTEQARYNVTTQQTMRLSPEKFAKIDFAALLLSSPETAASALLGADPGKIDEFGKKASTNQKIAVKNIVTPGTPAFVFLNAKKLAVAGTPEATRIQNIVNAIYGNPNFP